MMSEVMVGRLVLLASTVVLATGCASSGAVPQPFPVPGGGPTSTVPANSEPPTTPTSGGFPVTRAGPAEGYALSGTALSLRGAPYRDGGTTPAGFDCSGFVQYVFGLHGLVMPRETRAQFRVGHSVKRDNLAPGDLVFFSTVSPGASHVGIVIGGDQFVHAPSERGVVRIEHLSAEYWSRRFIGARRPL